MPILVMGLNASNLQLQPYLSGANESDYSAYSLLI